MQVCEQPEDVDEEKGFTTNFEAECKLPSILPNPETLKIDASNQASRPFVLRIYAKAAKKFEDAAVSSNFWPRPVKQSEDVNIGNKARRQLRAEGDIPLQSIVANGAHPTPPVVQTPNILISVLTSTILTCATSAELVFVLETGDRVRLVPEAKKTSHLKKEGV